MKLTEISEIPQMDVGAPSPTIIANDNNLYLSYYLLNKNKVDQSNSDIVTIKFRLFGKFTFGAPSSETISGHRYYKLGLLPYAVFELEQSTMIQELRVTNSVHPYHDDSRFDKFKHYIFTFHDRTFECVSEGYELQIQSSSIKEQSSLILDKIFKS